MRSHGPLIVLIAWVAMLSAFQVAYIAAGVPIPGMASLLIGWGGALAFILWIVADARQRRRVPCFDFGFLVAVLFPLTLVWYVFWSRGRRGVLTLAGLLALMALPWISGVLAWVLRYGLP